MVNILGRFLIDTGQILVTDPSYLPSDSGFKKTLLNVKSGIWRASAEIKNGICQALEIDKGDISTMWRLWGEVRAKNQLIGIFDLGSYPTNERKWILWYSHCCNMALIKGAGVIPKGVISIPGYGNGKYNILLKEDEFKNISVIRIEFCPSRSKLDTDDPAMFNQTKRCHILSNDTWPQASALVN